MNMLEKLKLRGPRVLVRQLSAISMTSSGLFLPGNQHEDVHHRGEVERVGPGERLPDGTVRPVQDLDEGDLVYFAKFAGTQLVLDGQVRLLLLEDEIQGAVDATEFSIVRHPDEAEADHLEGEPCAICLRPLMEAREAAARQELEAERERLRAAR